MAWFIYVIGVIVAFALLLGIRIREGKVTLGDLVFAVLFCPFSWIIVVIFVILSIDKLDDFVIWRRRR